jgi:transcription-repair coupling factor (superfamily II helicase)
VDPMSIVQLVQKHPERYRFEGATKLKFELKATNTDSKLSEIDNLLNLLIPK